MNDRAIQRKLAPGSVDRRELLAAASLGLLLLPARRTHAQSENPFAILERSSGGRLGVYVRDLGSGHALTHREDERFMLCSTFKGLLAALVLFDVDAGKMSLAQMIRYDAKDLLPASPISAAHAMQGALSVEDLCRAILHVSDNTAANLLLRQCGGPARLTAFLRSHGDASTRLDRYEMALGKRLGDFDTTTPSAIGETAQRLLLGSVLTAGSRALLERWMVENEVGHQRLRAALPATWRIADRTGTGDGMCNDYALARPPGRAPVIIAAYYEAPGRPTEQQETVLRAAGLIVAKWYERLEHA